MRADERKANQLRPVSLTLGVADFAEGSCLVCCGKTHIRCTASVQHQVPRWRDPKDGGWVTGEYDMLPRANRQRSGRAGGKGGRASEISRLIGRSLRAVTDLKRLPGLTITVDCDVLQADGGTRTAAITGGFVALVEACRWCVQNGLLRQLPLVDTVAAVSAGIVGGEALLDLYYQEDHDASVDANFVITGKGRFVEIQMSGEEATFDNDQMNRLLLLARRGTTQLARLQRDVLGPFRLAKVRA